MPATIDHHRASRIPRQKVSHSRRFWRTRRFLRRLGRAFNRFESVYNSVPATLVVLGVCVALGVVLVTGK